MFKDYDAFDWFLAGTQVVSGIFVGGLIFFMFMSIGNYIKAEEYCRKLPFEEYQKDTRCHEILED